MYRFADIYASGLPVSVARNLCAMTTDFGKRLKEARKAAKLTQVQLAKAAGIGQSTLAELEKSGYGSARVANLAEACGVSVMWLSDGTGSMRSTTTDLANTEPGPDLRGKVPLISWVQAGDWCHAADPHLPGQADRWMDCPVSHSANTFALRVRGDSMTAPHGNSRSYPEGCFIFVDPERRTPVNGDRVVACLSGTDEVTFKVYKNEDGRQWLQPLNPSHEPIRESFSIIGTVLGKWEDG